MKEEQVELDATYAEQNQRLWEEIEWEYHHARCFVCDRTRADIEAGRSGYYGEVRHTNDGTRYVCTEHKDQDTSQEEFDVADFVKSLHYHARINHHPEKKDEDYYKLVFTYFSKKRYRLINIPDGYRQYLRKIGQLKNLPEVAPQQQTLW